MKKLIYASFILLLLAGSFLMGSWYNQRNPVKTIPSGVKTAAVNAAEILGTAPDTSPLPAGTVNVSPEKQQLIGVKVARVEKAPWSNTLRVLGRIVPEETRIYRINAATDGWVKKMLPVTTDSLVRKDELLATFYAPEFSSALRAYLYGMRSLDRFEKSGKESKEQLEQTGSNTEGYRNSLRNLGMTEHQLDEIMSTRHSPENIEIRSPEAGFILARNITLGERFQKGTELYRIADLSKVWIVVATFEGEASSFKPGMSVRVSSPNLKKIFSARVAQVPPRFDPTSRTLQVRLEADNNGLLLRPDMFVDVDLPIQIPPAITIPAEAILDSGVKKIIFLDRGNGYFEPREVETGLRLGDRVEIVKGLEPGERIVVSGNFLIDSESKLELAAQGMYSAISKDPVCGTEVSRVKAEKAGRKVAYRGKTYYFDSEECKDQFQKNPGKFLKETAEGTPGEKAPSPKAPSRQQGHGHS